MKKRIINYLKSFFSNILTPVGLQNEELQNCGRKAKMKKHIRPPKPKNKLGFIQKAYQHIEKIKGHKSSSTIQNYLTALRSYKTFLMTMNMACDQDLRAILLEEYEEWMSRKGLRANTRSCYLRSLRALYHATMAHGKQKEDPFGRVFTGNAKTTKRAVDAKTICRLGALRFSKKEQKLQMSRDIFLFSTYAMGMPYVDIYNLRHEQVNDGFISYTRKKTGQKITVKVEKCMQLIINKYSSPKSDYIFPLKDKYTSSLAKYNRHLRMISAKAKLHHCLTSYVARHTWATLAYKEHIAMPIISQAMGHANENTTAIYIKKTDDDALWRANKKLLSLFIR